MYLILTKSSKAPSSSHSHFMHDALVKPQLISFHNVIVSFYYTFPQYLNLFSTRDLKEWFILNVGKGKSMYSSR